MSRSSSTVSAATGERGRARPISPPNTNRADSTAHGEAGFIHHPTNFSASGDPAHVAMPRVHRVASLLKRWLLGTHHGGMRVRHLDYYLDEYTFRFNRRSSKRRGLLFFRLLEQAVRIVDPVPIGFLLGGRA